MKLLVSLVAILLTSFVAKAATTEKEATVTLTERNTIVLRNVVDSQSVAGVQVKAAKLSQGLSKDEPIYLFLDTPGGEVGAGGELITALKGLPQKVHTITSFAASMGFITAQSLGNRYILPGGILMSHRARGGASGQIPGELNVRVKFFTDMLDDQDAAIAKRVGMSKSSYQNLIRDEYWVYGQKAVDAKMADRVILARCDKTLSEGKIVEIIYTFFGPVKVTYSSCPLISAPLEISFDGLSLSNYDDRDKVMMGTVRKTVLSLVYNKREFYHDYVLTNEYKKVLP